MAAMKRSALVDLFWKVHPKIYRFSGGRLLGHMVGMEVLLLTTRGRRSGKERSTCLTSFRDGEAAVVIGSFLGEARDPGWVHNLRAHPEATLQSGNEVRRVRARLAGVPREARGELLKSALVAVAAAGGAPRVVDGRGCGTLRFFSFFFCCGFVGFVLSPPL